VIHVEHLSKRFGHVRALRDVSFRAETGRVMGLLGPNGAGKSTTMRILAGLIPPTDGRASISGSDTVEASREARRGLGYLPENPPLYPEMRVRSFLRFRGALFGLSGRTLSKAVDEGIERCWLGGVVKQRVGNLSKGYKQRVGIASALMHDPPAVILDEPINGLDPEQIAMARKLIRELGQTKAVLFSSHILSEVQAVCDDIVIIAGGRMLAQGTMEQVIRTEHPTNRYLLDVPANKAKSLREHLTKKEHVVTVEIEAYTEQWHRVIVNASSEASDLREMLAQSVHDVGALARELRVDTPTLEQRYMQLLSEESS
jgi:gliding motility-associated transport system ATP-binding protein